MATFGHEMDPHLRELIRKSLTSDAALKELEKTILSDSILRSTIGTTQATDLIRGGFKANALPENAWALVNHRIASQRYSHNSQSRRSLILLLALLRK